MINLTNPYDRPRRPPRQAPGTVAGTAIVCLLAGALLGGVGVYMLVPDRAGTGGLAAEPATGQPATQPVGSAGAGPTTGGAAAPSDAAAPKTEAAVRAAATTEFDRYAAGDYGGAWDLWTARAKQTFSRDDYTRLHELCPGVEGIKFTIDEVTYQPGADTAKVRVSRLIATFTYEFVYEDGGWKFVPTDEAIADYQTHKTAEALAAARRAEGGCGDE